MPEIKLPWDERRDINIGTNEFVNQFTLNRNLNKLLENDKTIAHQMEFGTLTTLADDISVNVGTDTTMATTPHHLHMLDYEYVPLESGTIGLIQVDNGEYRYVINDFTTNPMYDLNTQQIRSIMVVGGISGRNDSLCEITYTIDTLPTVMLMHASGSSSNNDSELVSHKVNFQIPINHSTNSITFNLTSNAFTPYLEIIGCTQRIYKTSSTP